MVFWALLFIGHGESLTSPRTYYRHHLLAHSAEVALTDAATVLDDAATKCFWLSRGLPALAWTSSTVSGAVSPE